MEQERESRSEKPFDEKKLGTLAKHCHHAWDLIDTIRKRASRPALEQPKSLRPAPSASECDPAKLRPRIPEWSFAKDQEYNVLSVLGGRGSGKTTVLFEITRRLERVTNDIVLMPIQPERFGVGDSIVGWTLAALEDRVKQYAEFERERIECRGRRQGHGAREHDDEVRKILCSGQGEKRLLAAYRNVCQISSRVEYGFARSLQHGKPTAYEFGVEGSRLSEDGYKLRSVLHGFVEDFLYWHQQCASQQVRKVSRKASESLLVIPLDDADLAPDEAYPILQQLMVLLSHRRVLILIAGHEVVFEQALRAKYVQAARHLPDASVLDSPASSFGDVVTECVDRLLQKYFPARTRVEIKDLTPVERLLFSPVGVAPRRELLDLLRKAPGSETGNSEASPLPTLADYFDLRSLPAGEAIHDLPVPSQYSHMLPEMPRALVQLHEELSAIKTPDRVQTLETLWKHVRLAVPSSERPLLEKAVTWISRAGGRGAEGRSVVQLDYRGYMIDKIGGPGIPLELGHETTVNLRPIAGFQVWKQLGGGKSHRLSNALQNAVLFSTEFLQEGLDIATGTFGRLNTPGGPNWNVCLDVEYQGQKTDDRYWCVPNWDCYIDYLLYADAWNRLIELLQGLSAMWRRGADRASAVVEYAFLTHLEIVLHVQTERRSRMPEFKSAAELCECLGTGWPKDSECRLERLVADCTKLAAKAAVGPQGRATDFLNWFVQFLPWAADGVLLGTALSKQLLELWQGSVREIKYGERDLVAVTRRALERRLLGRLADSWATPCIELLASIGESTRNLETLRSTAREEQAQRRMAMKKLQRVVDRQVRRGVPPDKIVKLLAQRPSAEDMNALRSLVGPFVFRRLRALVEKIYDPGVGESEESQGDK